MMMRTIVGAASALWLWACTAGGENTYIVEGVVVEVNPPHEVVVDHEDIEGLMPAMVMGFKVSDPNMLGNLEPGHRIIARYVLDGPESRLNKIRITGKSAAPKLESAPIAQGAVWPATTVALTDGTTLTLGPEQTERVALTFIYTRCPLPEACPALVSRFQGLQAKLRSEDPGRLLAITLDPAYDTLPVLADYAKHVGAGPQWSFGRVEANVLERLALAAGMNIMPDAEDENQIAHGLRVIVLDRGGRLIERYDSPRFDGDRVVAQLKTGKAPSSPEQGEPDPSAETAAP